MVAFSTTDQNPPRTAALNLDMVVETPENVLLSYQVAGPAARCLAFGLDSIIRTIILVLVLLVALWSSQYLPGVTWGFVLVLMFALEWGYHVVSEGLFRGKTIGKDALGLRVVQLEGYPITFWSAMQRNLMRAADGVPIIAFLALTGRWPGETVSLSVNLGEMWTLLLMMPVYGPVLVSMVLTRRFQRLGDLVAGTVVISERRTRLSREAAIISRIDPLSREEIGPKVPGPETLALIDEFLSRREELTYDRGHELCANLRWPWRGNWNSRATITNCGIIQWLSSRECTSPSPARKRARSPKTPGPPPRAIPSRWSQPTISSAKKSSR